METNIQGPVRMVTNMLPLMVEAGGESADAERIKMKLVVNI